MQNADRRRGGAFGTVRVLPVRGAPDHRAAEPLRAEKNVVLAAVTQNLSALQFAAAALQEDTDVLWPRSSNFYFSEYGNLSKKFYSSKFPNYIYFSKFHEVSSKLILGCSETKFGIWTVTV